MAVTTDGRPVKVEDRSLDSASTSATSSAALSRQSRPSRSFSSWALRNLTRIAVWYTLITVIFRCPTSIKDLEEDSPQICQPYIATRTHVQPYVQPYYDRYAGPYVEIAKPYTDQLNARVIQPGSVIVATNYEKFAAPQLQKAKHYALLQWKRAVLPEVLRARKQAIKIYDANLAPHVDKASSAAGPYYEAARDNALDVHAKHIVPMITSSRPHLYNAYVTAQDFVLDTGLPFMQHVGSNIIIFVDGTLWPFIKTVYSDNVKPQLVMIRERIAQYQESRKLHSVISEYDASTQSTDQVESFASETSSQPSTSASETYSSSQTVESSSSSSIAAGPKQPAIATDESVSEDLAKWQKKFALAANKGGEDLGERIEEIIASLRKSGISEGEGLAVALEKTAEVELDTLKTKIRNLVKALPEDGGTAELEAAEAEVIQAIRASGQKVKGRATNVRNWAEKFGKELHQRTETVADSTLQVLDGIRDLGLQEIGMRWAWMEGVTYKHWQKYHDLKQRFEDWRTEVRDVALKHSLLKEAEEAIQQLLEESMAVTEQTAIELIRLKDVAKWKIRARDDTDNFESRAIPAAAVSAASSLAAELKDATSSLLGKTSTGSAESIASEASSGISEALSSASSYVAGSTGSVESLYSEASASVSKAAESASSVIIGTSTGSLEALSSSIANAASYATEAASESAVSAGNVVNEVKDQVSSSLSSMVSSATAPPSGSILDKVSALADSISSPGSSMYANARDASYSKSLQSVVNAAGDGIEDVTSSLSSLIA